MIESFQRRYNITSKDMQNLEQDIFQYGKSSAATEWSYSNAVLFAGTTVLTVGELYIYFIYFIYIYFIYFGRVALQRG